MTKKAKLVILRHGETEYNKQDLLTGQHNPPLTEAGEEQAHEAGKLIGPIRFDKVYSSNLSRAFNTAALALKSSKTQTHLLKQDGNWHIEQRPEIAEIDSGDLSGRHKNSPEVLSFPWRYDSPFPSGESMEQVVARVQKFFDAEVLPRLQKGENVLIVAHAGIVRAFDFVLGFSEIPAAGQPSERRRIPNAAPTVHEYEDGVLTGSSYLGNAKTPAANQNNPPAKKKKHGPKK
jgi:2,3-bisphosphoglycerate-dependent phosphoglycerate mutase